MDFVSKFIDHMATKGCAPADPTCIIPDDKKRRYVLEGDHKRATNATYQLRIEGDFAVGWFRSFREGVTHTFSAHTGGKKSALSPEERQAIQAKRDAKLKEQKDRIRAEHAEAAKKAEAIWAKASTKGVTAYLVRKGAQLNGARIWKNLVVVPIKIGGKLTSLQFIAESGDKRFIKESELVGGYFSIASKGDDLSRMVICEGFATGDAIRQSTGAVVVVAFNSGNLESVARAIRKKYPDTAITFAADNDQFTTVKDVPTNVGILAAQKAARSIGGAKIAYPEFASGDVHNRPTDFNDAFLLYGAEYVRDRITTALMVDDVGGEAACLPLNTEECVQSADLSTDSLTEAEAFNRAAPPIDAYSENLPDLRNLTSDTDWRGMLITTEKGNLKSTSMHNCILYLKFHEAFRGIYAWNDFAQNITMRTCPPWERENKFKVRRLDDVSVINCSAELEKHGLNIGPEKVHKAIQAVAADDHFHPARQYFNGLKWDGIPRLATWLTYYLGCEDESSEYLAFIGTKWLTAAVKRVYMPGCKFDHVLILEGDQGIGKSTMLRLLATFGDEDGEESYFTDSVNLASIEDKDSTLKMQGSIIIELAELSGFGKKEDEAIKKWIGYTFDDARPPYGREVVRYFRQFVLAATTNKHDYLKDPTGNRRYWPTMAKHIDFDALRADKQQLWAEAVHNYHNGMYIGPTREEERLANIERQKRLSIDVWSENVMRAVDDVLETRLPTENRGIRIVEIMNAMSMPVRDRDDRSMRRIAGILQTSGMESKAVWNSQTKRSERLWIKKGEVA